MKKMHLVVLLAFVAFVFSVSPISAAIGKVPVNIGEGVITITIPVVVNDQVMAIQAATSREMPWNKKGEISPYQVEVYYPAEWGKLSIQHHLIPGSEAAGLFTVSYAHITDQSSVSFMLDVKHPLANLDKEAKTALLPKLLEGLGGDQNNVKGLTLTPDQGLVHWRPTERGELRKIAGLASAKDKAPPIEQQSTPQVDKSLSVERVVLPPQASGSVPFIIKRVDVAWGTNQGNLKSLVSKGEVMPYLASVQQTMEMSYLRVKEGFLGVIWQGECTFLAGDTALKLIPFQRYYVAVRQQ